MKTYNSYHTYIKQLARSDALPLKYADNIDRSTLWRWKQEKEDKYLGCELSDIQILQKFLERQESDAIIKSYLKIAMAISSILRKTNQFHRYLNQNKDFFVKILMQYSKAINISLILKLLNLSASTYHYWKNQVLFPCKTSTLKLCRRLYPNQLTEKETFRIKSLLMDPKFRYWPVSSIYHFARRTNLLQISLSSWYGYMHS